MSRSYKKNKILKACGDTKYKKIFNRRIRRAHLTDNIDDGGAYKKLNDSYDIHDYICKVDWEDFKTWKWAQESFQSEGEAKAFWKSHYNGK